MKAKSAFLILGIILIACSAKATEIPTGPVSGDWYSSGNPYNINGEIYVNYGMTLNIHEGVDVIFQGHYTLTVNGTLQAIGTESDSILFTVADTLLGWGDILFQNSSTDNIISFCIIQYGKAYGTSDCGGAVELVNGSSVAIDHSTVRWNRADLYGGGISCWGASDLTLESCLITENHALGHGGISLYEETYIRMNNCTISNNTSDNIGGGMAFCSSFGEITNCLFAGNQAAAGGGGVICLAYESHPTFSGCTFTDNSSGIHGAGVNCTENASATFYECNFSGNYAGINGGAFVAITPGNIILDGCLITGNTAAQNGGGIRVYAANNPIIKGCTIANNVAVAGVGGGISIYNSTPGIVNTIIEGNEGNGGIYFNDFTPASLTYCDVVNNSPQNLMGYVPTGIGVLCGMNANGDSCDVFANIFEDPLFENPSAGNYQITWSNFPIWDETRSPCIDAGNPTSPFDPDFTITDIGALYFDQGATNPVTVTLTPYGMPIQIPVGGGSFDFNIEIANTGMNQETFDIWTMATLPNSSQYGPIINVPDFTAPASWSSNRDRIQLVPGGAPSGTYTYDAYVGVYPDDIWNEGHFEFEKLAGEGNAQFFNWESYGEEFDENTSTLVMPDKVMLLKAYPNPFNPTTIISYQLPIAGYMTLRVFDVQGREVATLVNGYRSAGSHEVTFGGSNLASGIYIYHLEAGDFNTTGKMVLMK